MTCQRDPRSGAAAVTFAISLIVILGFAGMAVDLGRLMLIKSEAQSYCDAAALAAVSALDGVSFGPADAAAHQAWKRWDLENESFVSHRPSWCSIPLLPDSGWGGGSRLHRALREGAGHRHARHLPAAGGHGIIGRHGLGGFGCRASVIDQAGSGAIPLRSHRAELGRFARNFGFEKGMTYAFRWGPRRTRPGDGLHKPHQIRRHLSKHSRTSSAMATCTIKDGTMRTIAETSGSRWTLARSRFLYWRWWQRKRQLLPESGAQRSNREARTWGVGIRLISHPGQTIRPGSDEDRISQDTYPRRRGGTIPTSRRSS